MSEQKDNYWQEFVDKVEKRSEGPVIDRVFLFEITRVVSAAKNSDQKKLLPPASKITLIEQ